MRIGRTIPPAAAPIQWKNIANGILGAFRGERESKRFVKELKEYFKTKHCFLVSSGKTALTLILEALKQLHPERNKVLIPAFTCYSVPSAIKRAGLDVMLCDISTTGFDFDFRQLEPLLADKKLLCVVPTHLYGIPANVDGLEKMLSDPEVTIVEDAAQAMGNLWRGQKLGASGGAGFFSLGRGKAFSTVEGGIILTDREDIGCAIGEQCENLPSYRASEIVSLLIYALALKVLMNPLMYWLPSGLPFLRLGETIYDPNFKMRKLSNFQAGLSAGWFEQLNWLRTKRKENATYWRETLLDKTNINLIAQNENLPDMLRFPIKVLDEKAKTRLLNGANKLGLGLAEGYPDTIAGIEELSEQFRGLGYPQAKSLSKQMMTLPLHSFLTKKDLYRIQELLNQN